MDMASRLPKIRDEDQECKVPLKINDRITLDVGGTRFTTTRLTLCSEADSMLARMFHVDQPLYPCSTTTANSDASVFLDRDPDCFRIVLQYLRNGALLSLLSI